MALLNVVKGTNPGETIELTGERIVMGRNADCQVVLNVPAVSREHAVIRKIQGKYYIEDMKSRNGTFVNNKEVTTRTLLRDNDKIKICDNILAFYENVPLPEHMTTGTEEAPDDEEDKTSSTIEATLAQSTRQVLELQTAKQLSMLIDVGAEMMQTFQLEELLPKIVDHIFRVFLQADRVFVILVEDGKLIPKEIRTRRTGEETSARFSRGIVRRCLETGQSLLSEDASSDARWDLSQSIADCRIRSVMCVPLKGRGSEEAFGVIQLDTQDRFKKFTQEDLKLLLAVAGQAAVALEASRMHESLVARAGLERDLKLAHDVQKSFLPKRPPQLAGYEFFAYYESAQEVGGDYYDFIPLPGPRIGVMVGDVAGKGVPAALLMAKVSSEARYMTLTEPDFAKAITQLNSLTQEAGMLDRFVTLIACLVDPARHEVTFVNAGHLPPLVYRQEHDRIEEGTDRKSSGLPLGVDDGFPYEATVLALSEGDTVLLCTDGITEAKSKEDQEFHTTGVLTALKGGPMNARAMVERVVAAAKQHAQGAKQSDDITVVAFGRVRPQPASSLGEQSRATQPEIDTRALAAAT